MTRNRLTTFRLRALAIQAIIAGLGAGPIAGTAAHAATPAADTGQAAAVVQSTAAAVTTAPWPRWPD